MNLADGSHSGKKDSEKESQGGMSVEGLSKGTVRLPYCGNQLSIRAAKWHAATSLRRFCHLWRICSRQEHPKDMPQVSVTREISSFCGDFFVLHLYVKKFPARWQ